MNCTDALEYLVSWLSFNFYSLVSVKINVLEKYLTE